MNTLTHHVLIAQLAQRVAVVLPFILAGFALPSAGRAQIKTESLDYKDGDVTCKGFIAYPAAASAKPAPAVLVFPEWWGLTDYSRNRARQLADMGYVALAADMFGDGKVAADPAEAGKLAGGFYFDRTKFRARAGAALAALSNRPEVDKSKIAAIGYCFGGTTALELARGGATLVAVVSFHGGLSTPHPETDNIKAHVMAINGGDDAFVKPAEREAFEKEMRDAKVDWVLVDLGNAVHAFSNPEADSHNMANVKYNATADRRSFQMMKNFLAEIFGS